FERRLEQNELAIPRYQVVENLLVSVSFSEPLAHEQSEVAGERCFGIIYRLVLADHATQLARQIACAPLQDRVFEHLVWLHSQRCARQERGQQSGNYDAPHGPYSAGCITDFAAGFGAPTRSLRSDNDSAPPNAIITAPSQIKSTIGLW